jgi:site-specific DNA-methyltransferase (adenine-specific)
MSKCLKDFLAVTGENYKVFHGSNLDVLPFMADNSVDSIVTDPPYELGFMGKSWDSSGIAYSIELWRECLRVLKPGGHLLAFGGSRTWHRLAVAIEDSGFEVRDSIAWLYGSGFPKSHNISIAIDKQAGAMGHRGQRFENSGLRRQGQDVPNPAGIEEHETITAEAEKWVGWGTALKPAFEPVVVARKPFAKGNTVAANVLEWGVGGLNIDASRISAADSFGGGAKGSSGFAANYGGEGWVAGSDLGRWPANIILDEFTAELLDEQSGTTTSGAAGKKASSGFPGGGYDGDYSVPYGDTGGASRFFYVSKTNKRDRNEGLDGLPQVRASAMGYERGLGDAGEGMFKDRNPQKQNFHPTVKPTDLMRYLIKLVTPAGGVVLDPFTGSGSTGKAALLDGYQFIGIELTEDYLPIIEGRLRWANEQNKETLFDE